MITRIFVFLCVIVVLSSCARAITPGEAATGSYKKCRAVR